MNPPQDMLRRQEAAQATLDKFRGKALDWQAGMTCVHLARYHLLRMGHKVPPMPRLRSLLTARRELNARGWADCRAMLDAQPGLAAIPSAMMLLGDLAVLASDDGDIGSIMVCAGPNKLLGWREDAPALVVLDVDFSEITAAWRL